MGNSPLTHKQHAAFLMARGYEVGTIAARLGVSELRVKQLLKKEKACLRFPTLYFVQVGGFIKIGVSLDMERRLKHLRAGCPYAVTLLGVIENSSREEEAELHERFNEDRLHNEWFRSSERLVSWIAQYTTKCGGI